MSAVPYRRTLARLLSFLRPYKPGLVISIVLAIGSQAAQIALIWVTGRGGIGQALVVPCTTQLRLYVGAIASLGLSTAVVAPARPPSRSDVQQTPADGATGSEENVGGVHGAKPVAEEPAEEEKFRGRNEALVAQTIRANRQRATYVPLLSFVPLLAQAAVLLFGARMVAHGSLTVGSFVSFNLYLALLVMPLRSLGMWIGQAQRATASGERIFEVLDEPEEVADRPGAVELPPGGGLIRFENVGFEYLPGQRVLDGIDLEIPAGKTIAVIGHTGSGKTTLTALVPRFYDVTEGRVAIDGADVRDVTLRSLRREIGIIPQDTFLFSATVRENITFGAPELSDAEVEHAARLAQAHEFVER